MAHRLRVLVFIKFYLPGYRAGGPIRTIANMVERLGDDFDFRVVTLDRDLGDKTPYPGMGRGVWVSVGKAKVMYLGREVLSIPALRKIILEASPDVIYLNSFFDPFFSQRVLLARRLGNIGRIPIVLAPRGEFSPGALGLKRRRKAIFIRACRITGMYDDLTWQASSAEETVHIRRSLPFLARNSIVEAMNLAPDALPVEAPAERPGDARSLNVCFFSRISPKKNLDFALRVLAMVRSEVRMTIFGPQEVPAYWVECEALIDSLPSNVQVTYAGELNPSEVRGTLSRHDLFLLPTRGENYGHVIHEALGAGLPVLISDQTPWNDVAERGVGWSLPLHDVAQFAAVIDSVAGWPTVRRAAVRRDAVAYAAERAGDESVLAANRALFLNAAGRTAK